MGNEHRMSVDALRATAANVRADKKPEPLPNGLQQTPYLKTGAIGTLIPGTPENWNENGPLGNDPAHVQVYKGPNDDADIDRALDLVSVSFRIPRKTWEEFQIKIRSMPTPAHEAVVLRAMVTLFNKNDYIAG